MAKNNAKKSKMAKPVTKPKPAVKTKPAVKAKPVVKVKSPGKTKSVKAQPKKAIAAKGKNKSAVKKVVMAKAKPTKVVKTKATVTQKTAVKMKPVKKQNPATQSAPSKATKWSTPSTNKNKKSESYFKSYLKPLDDRLVVIVNEMEKMTPGGLYIPDTVTDVSGNYQGKVMAIGRGHMNKKGKVKPLDVSVGDEIIFSQFSGSQIDVDGNNIMVIRESDVLGIVK